MPLLCREVDVLWQALCPAYFWASPLHFFLFKPKTEPLRRCLSSYPHSYDTQIRKVPDSQYSKRGERAERYRKARDFFLRGRNAHVNAPKCTGTNSQKARRPRNKGFFSSQDASFNTVADTSRSSRSMFGLQEFAARWVPSAFKRDSPVPIPQKEGSDYVIKIENELEEPKIHHGGSNEVLNGVQAVKHFQDRADERPQKLGGGTIRDSLLAISEDYGVLSKPNQIPLEENLELKRPSPRASTASLRRTHGTSESELSTDVLYETLRKASADGDYIRIREVLRTLIENRGEQPNRRHYQAMLLGNTNAQHGTPAEVAHILQEMDTEGISLDSAAYHAILKVSLRSWVNSHVDIDHCRSLQYILTICYGGTCWKNFVSGGSISPMRVGKMSSLDC